VDGYLWRMRMLYICWGLLLCSQWVSGQGGRPVLQEGFENGAPVSWTSTGGNIRVSDQVFHSGAKSLQVGSGEKAGLPIKLLSGHRYRLSGWVRTASGSDAIQINTEGLGSQDVSLSSSLSDWVKVVRDFSVSAAASGIRLVVYHPRNAAENVAWADDLELVDLGSYRDAGGASLSQLAPRVPVMDQGIAQQPNGLVNWLLDARFGMFIHWGLYAGPARGEWYMENAGITPEAYRRFAYAASGDQYFQADQFEPDAWANLARDAGMRYMCLTTMHHDGYGLFESRYMNAFNSKQTHNRDFVAEYTAACRKAGLKVGLYKTLINWRYPGYYDVGGAGAKPNRWGYVTDSAHPENARLMKEELYCQVKELMTKYGKIDLIYWDGGWLGQQGSDADAAYFWEPGKFRDPDNQWAPNPCFNETDSSGKALGLMGIVRKFQPDVLVNPRSGWKGDYKDEEGSFPVTGPVRSSDIYIKEMTVGGAWGYTRAMEDSAQIISPAHLKRMLADVVIRNMSLLLNVGPDRHGRISRPVVSLLESVGNWIKPRAEAIYGTYGGPWDPVDGQYGFAFRDSTIYLFLLDGYTAPRFELPPLSPDQKVLAVDEIGAHARAVPVSRKGGRVSFLVGAGTDNVRIFAIHLNKAVIPSISTTVKTP